MLLAVSTELGCTPSVTCNVTVFCPVSVAVVAVSLDADIVTVLLPIMLLAACAALTSAISALPTACIWLESAMPDIALIASDRVNNALLPLFSVTVAASVVVAPALSCALFPTLDNMPTATDASELSSDAAVVDAAIGILIDVPKLACVLALLATVALIVAVPVALSVEPADSATVDGSDTVPGNSNLPLAVTASIAASVKLLTADSVPVLAIECVAANVVRLMPLSVPPSDVVTPVEIETVGEITSFPLPDTPPDTATVHVFS